MDVDQQYDNKFYVFKYVFMLILLYTRKWKNCFTKPREECLYEKYDEPQHLSPGNLALDSIYFNGSSEDGIYFSVGFARRPNNRSDVFLMLKISQVDPDILILPKMPCTTIAHPFDSQDKFEADGLRLTCLTPMNQWRIEYSGIMKGYNETSSLYAVKLDLVWTACSAHHFIFEKDMSPVCVASTSARQRWSNDYFKAIEKLQQIRFAQIGYMTGSVEVNGAMYELIDLRSLRDRCICDVRDWRIYHRYVLHTIALKNGDVAHVGVMSAPIIYTNWPIGFIYRKKFRDIFPLTSIDFDLSVHGEHGKPPSDYKFTFRAADGGKFCVDVIVLDSTEYFVSKDWECRILERFCLYKVNGMPGWGICQWLYRNFHGKQVRLEKPYCDPRYLAELLEEQLQPYVKSSTSSDAEDCSSKCCTES